MVDRFGDISLLVGNSSRIEYHIDVCDTYQGSVSDVATLKCQPARLAHYVTIMNHPQTTEYDLFGLCEVTVAGYQAIGKSNILCSIYIPYHCNFEPGIYISVYIVLDCSACEDGNCDDFHGCDMCPLGKMKPDCKQGNNNHAS